MARIRGEGNLSGAGDFNDVRPSQWTVYRTASGLAIGVR
jgi:hypothetical protein